MEAKDSHVLQEDTRIWANPTLMFKCLRLLRAQRVGGDDAICLPGETFVNHDRLEPVGRGSVMDRRMRTFTVTSGMGRGGVLMAVANAFANSPAVEEAFTLMVNITVDFRFHYSYLAKALHDSVTRVTALKNGQPKKRPRKVAKFTK